MLFKIIELEDGRLDTVLCIPTSKVHVLLDTYHSSLIGGHSGITKCYQTIRQRFYCPNLAENLRAYITGCHICQMFKKGKNFQRPYQKRMNINTPAMTRISMDIKQMQVNRGYSHILVLLCEVSNYMVALPLSSTRTQNILEAFQRGYLAYFGPPTHIICDQDPALLCSYGSICNSVKYQGDISKSYKSQIITGRTWYKEPVRTVSKTFITSFCVGIHAYHTACCAIMVIPHLT